MKLIGVILFFLFVHYATSQTVTRVYVVDSARGVVHTPLLDGQTFTLSAFPWNGFNIFAEFNKKPYKVVMQYDSLPIQTEYGAPYALFGDAGKRLPTVGRHSVRVVPYISSGTPANAGVTIGFTITYNRALPVIVGRVSVEKHILLVGDTTAISTLLYDTSNHTADVTVKSISYQIDQYGTSIKLYGDPGWYYWKAPAEGIHYIYGSGIDSLGRSFTTSPETLYVVTPEMVQRAQYIKYRPGGAGIESIITGAGK